MADSRGARSGISRIRWPASPSPSLRARRTRSTSAPVNGHPGGGPASPAPASSSAPMEARRGRSGQPSYPGASPRYSSRPRMRTVSTWPARTASSNQRTPESPGRRSARARSPTPSSIRTPPPPCTSMCAPTASTRRSTGHHLDQLGGAPPAPPTGSASHWPYGAAGSNLVLAKRSGTIYRHGRRHHLDHARGESWQLHISRVVQSPVGGSRR